MIQSNVAKRTQRVLEIASAMAEKVDPKSYAVRNHIEAIELHFEGYAEPGYNVGKSGIIATGNWNNVDKYVPGPGGAHGSRVLVSTLPSRLCAIFEKMGIEIVWSDEWCACNECGKLVRTSPDSYGWKRSYIETNDGCFCVECVEKDSSSHLEDLEGKDDECNTIDSIDPAEHGYVKVEDCESGWHPGQNDSPQVVAERLKKKGISRFLFNLDDVGQFDMKWSAWIREDEKHLLEDKG